MATLNYLLLTSRHHELFDRHLVSVLHMRHRVYFQCRNVFSSMLFCLRHLQDFEHYTKPCKTTGATCGTETVYHLEHPSSHGIFDEFIFPSLVLCICSR